MQLKKWKEKIVSILLSPIRLFKVLCFTVGLVVILVSMGLSLAVYSFFHSLPDLEQYSYADLKKVTVERVKSRLENSKSHFSWTPLDRVNREYLYAIVMSEDGTFFKHQGINYDALIYSFAENIKRREYAFGGSTISQQVVKNVFLGSEKNLVRKLKEFVLTSRMERQFTKNQILELYLNLVELGPDLFGVSAASRHYFGKRAGQVNAAEGAFIALMLPSPRKNHFTIFKNKNISKRRKRKLRRVFNDLLRSEYISPKQYKMYVSYRYFK